MKIYNLIETLLTDEPAYRDSDKRLIWRVWEELGFIWTAPPQEHRSLDFVKFMEAPSTETIRRCRQKIQELHPELQSSKPTRERRSKIAEERGNHIFRETTGEQKSLI